MTTALVCRAGSNPSPPTHPSEVAFEAFLRTHGYGFEKESYEFEIEVGPRGHSSKFVRPDYKILWTPDGICHDRLYIEITEADNHPDAKSLSAKVRNKNRRFGDSGKEFIQPSDYLRRKRERMQKAEGIHGIVIIVLTYADQQAIFAEPSLLEARVATRIQRLSLHRSA